jgi:hypothetical protein
VEFTDDHYNTHELAGLIYHSGVLTERDWKMCLRNNEITVDGQIAKPQHPLADGNRVLIRGCSYDVCNGGGNARLQLVGTESSERNSIGGEIRVHAGYHKCLSEYAKKVYHRTCKHLVLPNASFRHYYHRADAFYADCARHKITSISGQCLDLDRFDDIKIVRFVRDPRDLLVSGYFYHKRGAEHWCALENPTDLDWLMVNGAVPGSLPADTSLTTYLNAVSLEEGLFAELEFRRFHFESMMAWPDNDSRIRVFQYEDILGHEAQVFGEIFEFYGFSLPVQFVGKHYARKYRAGQRSSIKSHIRNPSSGQWRQYFTPQLTQLFSERYEKLLTRYNYPVE